MKFRKGFVTGIMQKIIDQRRLLWNSWDESTRQANRWNLSDVYYATRKKIADMGYNVDGLSQGTKREDMTRYIKTYCDRFDIKRHDIGIFAKDRAILLFNGVEYSVNFENIERLFGIGADLICVEKSGIVEKIGPFVKDFGIALLHSEGFIAENGVMLAQKADRHQANVAIVTDFDSGGISIGISLTRIKRIGVDFDTINEINKIIDEINADPELKAKYIKKIPDLEEKLKRKITAKLVEEPYHSADHGTQLRYLANGECRDKKDGQYWSIVTHQDSDHLTDYMDFLNKKIGDTDETYEHYLRTKRFEIDSILREVTSQVFWDWLKKKILETFPTRNYNRSIFVSRYLLTPTMIRFVKGLKKYSEKILKDLVDVKRFDLYEHTGLTDVNIKTDEINSDLIIDLHNKPEIFLIDKRLEQLMNDFGVLSNDE